MLPKKLKLNPARQGVILSGVLSVALVAHLVSSDVVVAGKAHEKEGSAAVENSKPIIEKKRLDVEVIQSPSENIYKELVVYGRTEPERIVSLKSEIAAPVAEIKTDEGIVIEAGAPMLVLDSGTLDARLGHASALVKQRALEFESAKTLEKEGFQARLFVAEAETQLAYAKAQLAELQKEKRNTQITAPFTAVVNKRLVEQGDYVQPGDNVIELIDLDPIVVRVHIPETRIGEVHLDQIARIRMLDGELHEARVSYIAQNSSAGTNTFDVELSIANPDMSLNAGVSAEAKLYTESVLASKISPSYLSLDDKGKSGLYVVEDGVARFKPASIIRSDSDSLWVEGLGLNPLIIISGHHHVRDGDPVDYQAQKLDENPAVQSANAH